MAYLGSQYGTPAPQQPTYSYGGYNQGTQPTYASPTYASQTGTSYTGAQYAGYGPYDAQPSYAPPQYGGQPMYGASNSYIPAPQTGSFTTYGYDQTAAQQYSYASSYPAGQAQQSYFSAQAAPPAAVPPSSGSFTAALPYQGATPSYVPAPNYSPYQGYNPGTASYVPAPMPQTGSFTMGIPATNSFMPPPSTMGMGGSFAAPAPGFNSMKFTFVAEPPGGGGSNGAGSKPSGQSEMPGTVGPSSQAAPAGKPGQAPANRPPPGPAAGRPPAGRPPARPVSVGKHKKKKTCCGLC